MNDARPRTLVIGCGNLLRGDDAVGPVLVRRLWERGLPGGVTCVDGGTGGMDVAFQMRGCAWVVLVDTCRRDDRPRQSRAGSGAAKVSSRWAAAAQCSSSFRRPPSPTRLAVREEAGRPSDGAAIYELPGEEVENLPPVEGINLHAFRWDHAIAFGRWLLKDEYPRRVTAFLIEGESFEPGAELSPAVDRAVDELVEVLAVRLAEHAECV